MTYSFIDHSEKVAILEAQVRTLEYGKYTCEVSKMAEQAKTSPDTDTILSLTNQIADKERQIAALLSERDDIRAAAAAAPTE